MSKHHHHSHEGHRSGGHPTSSRKPIHHDWRFYAAALLILVAMLIYVFSADLSWSPGERPEPSTGNGMVK